MGDQKEFLTQTINLDDKIGKSKGINISKYKLKNTFEHDDMIEKNETRLLFITYHTASLSISHM